MVEVIHKIVHGRCDRLAEGVALFEGDVGGNHHVAQFSIPVSLLYQLSCMGWVWSTPPPGRFIAVKETRYPLYSRLGGPHGRSGRVRKTSPPPGSVPRTVQPAASRKVLPILVLGLLYTAARTSRPSPRRFCSHSAFACGKEPFFPKFCVHFPMFCDMGNFVGIPQQQT